MVALRLLAHPPISMLGQSDRRSHIASVLPPDVVSLLNIEIGEGAGAIAVAHLDRLRLSHIGADRKIG